MNAIEGIGAKGKSESDGWTRSSREHHRPDGPHPGVIAIIVLALSVMALLVPAGMAGGMFFPSPYGSTQTVWMYLTEHRDSSVATGFLTFAASVPLGIFTATVYARLLRLGIRVPGPNIAFAGGITATILLAMSGLLTWSLGQSIAGESAALLHLGEYVAYALGGVGFIVGIGLLIAGIAVPSLILHLTPSWVAWIGLLLAALAEISVLVLLVPQLAFLLPIGRFVGVAWLVVAGFLLPRNRHNTAQPSQLKEGTP